MIEKIIILMLIVCAFILFARALKREKDLVHKSNKRLEYLENYINQYIKKNNTDSAFIATFEIAGIDGIENQLNEMLDKADQEIMIITPWITWDGWKRYRRPIQDFIRNGGQFKLYMRGEKGDFEKGLSNENVVKEIKNFGGTVKFVPNLHAKIFLIDREEIIITSANLTGRGLDHNYESGIWTCNPVIVQGAYNFVTHLEAFS